MAKFVQFGEIIVNVDEVISVRRDKSIVRVYITPAIESHKLQGVAMSAFNPNVLTYRGDAAVRVWNYFMAEAATNEFADIRQEEDQSAGSPPK